MRKVVAWELVSLDGVMESPERWSFQFHNDEMAEANASGMAAADAMLFGRVTYQEFAAFWPYQNSAEQPFTDYLNNTPKYVVSTTLEEPLEWQNSTLIKDNVAEVVASLKQQPGKDIGIVGSGTWSGRYFAMGSWTSSGSWSTLSSWAAGSACSRRRGSRRLWISWTRRPSARESST